ncbi:MAG TPA: class I tRNA ligase family protein, partial [Clostridiaceae bacterium]|nr:class I tRNA ligase family protein [Clostridiaceae bacterium]
ISRQLWWGHRIPAYYCDNCEHIVVAKEKPTVCPECGCTTLQQDPDTLDTWFSSALWPFSTLGWPEETADLKFFYPTNTLVTGWDIIFFWVARMIFSALEQTGEVPFDHVFIHGIVLDENGVKMSKSLGNGIDPLEVIEEYGADALRYALVMDNAPGNNQRYKEDKLKNGSALINKVWNAFRFVMMNLDESLDFNALSFVKDDPAIATEDCWIMSRYNQTVAEVTENLEKFELGIALGKIIDFFWDDFCDWYIEMIKYRLYGDDVDERSSVAAQYTARSILIGALQLLHPFMPFFTTEIYNFLPGIKENDELMLTDWPTFDPELADKDSEKQIGIVMDATRKIRAIRLEMNVPVKRKTPLYVLPDDQVIGEIFLSGAGYLDRLANVSAVELVQSAEAVDDNAVSGVVEGAEFFIPLESLVDFEQEIKRLAKERDKLEADAKRFKGKLSNKNFVEKAPEHVVQAERDRLAGVEDMLTKVIEQLENMEKNLNK